MGMVMKEGRGGELIKYINASRKRKEKRKKEERKRKKKRKCINEQEKMHQEKKNKYLIIHQTTQARLSNFNDDFFLYTFIYICLYFCSL